MHAALHQQCSLPMLLANAAWVAHAQTGRDPSLPIASRAVPHSEIDKLRLSASGVLLGMSEPFAPYETSRRVVASDADGCATDPPRAPAPILPHPRRTRWLGLWVRCVLLHCLLCNSERRGRGGKARRGRRGRNGGGDGGARDRDDGARDRDGGARDRDGDAAGRGRGRRRNQGRGRKGEGQGARKGGNGAEKKQPASGRATARASLHRSLWPLQPTKTDLDSEMDAYWSKVRCLCGLRGLRDCADISARRQVPGAAKQQLDNDMDTYWDAKAGSGVGGASEESAPAANKSVLGEGALPAVSEAVPEDDA